MRGLFAADHDLTDGVDKRFGSYQSEYASGFDV